MPSRLVRLRRLLLSRRHLCARWGLLPLRRRAGLLLPVLLLAWRRLVTGSLRRIVLLPGLAAVLLPDGRILPAFHVPPASSPTAATAGRHSGQPRPATARMLSQDARADQLHAFGGRSQVQWGTQRPTPSGGMDWTSSSNRTLLSMQHAVL